MAINYSIGISPGVYTQITDLSTYLNETSGMTAYIPFLSMQGPENELVYISQAQSMAAKFGYPSQSHVDTFTQNYAFGLYTAWQHVNTSPSMYCMRVMPQTAKYANLVFGVSKNATVSGGSLSNLPDTAQGIVAGSLDTDKATYQDIVNPDSGQTTIYSASGINMNIADHVTHINGSNTDIYGNTLFIGRNPDDIDQSIMTPTTNDSKSNKSWTLYNCAPGSYYWQIAYSTTVDGTPSKSSPYVFNVENSDAYMSPKSGDIFYVSHTTVDDTSPMPTKALNTTTIGGTNYAKFNLDGWVKNAVYGLSVDTTDEDIADTTWGTNYLGKNGYIKAELTYIPQCSEYTSVVDGTTYYTYSDNDNETTIVRYYKQFETTLVGGVTKYKYRWNNDAKGKIAATPQIGNNSPAYIVFDTTEFSYEMETTIAGTSVTSRALNQTVIMKNGTSASIKYTYVDADNVTKATSIVEFLRDDSFDPSEFEQNSTYSNVMASDLIGESSSADVSGGTMDSMYFEYILMKGHYNNLQSQYVKGESGEVTFGEEHDRLPIMQPGGDQPILMFLPSGCGSYYNGYQVTIQNTVSSLVEGGAKLRDAQFNFQVKATTPTGIKTLESFVVAFDPEAYDTDGNSIFIVDVINKYSEYISVYWDRETYLKIKDFTPFETIFPMSSPVTYTFAEGNDGYGFVGNTETEFINPTTNRVNADLANILLQSGYNGTSNNNIEVPDDLIYNTDNLYLPVVYDAGYPKIVKDAANFLVETRQDGVLISDAGDFKNADKTVEARTGDSAVYTYNNRLMAMYAPYSQVYDGYTATYKWVPPEYHMAQMLAANDKLYQVWYPSAGYNRGMIDNITKLRFNCNLKDRDNFYLNQINPIVQFAVGYTVWGQLTSQRKSQKMSDLNVVRTVLYIKRAVEQFLKYYIFELNNSDTWTEMNKQINDFLSQVQTQKGIESYTLDIGATEYEKTRKACHCIIGVVPSQCIERIYVDIQVR